MRLGELERASSTQQEDCYQEGMVTDVDSIQNAPRSEYVETYYLPQWFKRRSLWEFITL